MIEEDLLSLAERGAAAQAALIGLTGAERRAALHAMADALEAARDAILAANAEDLAAASGRGRPAVRLARMELGEARLAGLVRSVRAVADGPDPLGRRESRWVRPNGLAIERVRVPLGTVGVCAETRPRLLPVAAAACVKAADALVFVSDDEARATQEALFGALRAGAESGGVPEDALQMRCEADPRPAARALVALEGRIDLALLRGSDAFVRDLVEHASVPVYKHFAGPCHVYVDRDRENPDVPGRPFPTDLTMALGVILDARLFEPWECYAATVALVHRDIAPRLLPLLAAAAAKRGLELRADERAAKFLPGARAASPEDFRRTPPDLSLAVGVVDGMAEAVARINRDGAHLSDAIVTGSPDAARDFQRRVDSTTVYANASTCFTDGAEFGMAADLGISTDKAGPRGAIGPEAFTGLKYVATGDGQTRGGA